jgi:hypothetical protein
MQEEFIMKRLFSLLIGVIGVSLVLLSCVIPEKFTCDINITKSGTYSVAVKGTLVFSGVFDELENQGRVSEKTDNDIKNSFDEELRKEAAIKKYEYKNNGREYIEYLKEVTDGSSLDLSAYGLPLAINVEQNGIISVRLIAVSSNDREFLTEFSKYGYKLDGKITITSELPVIDDGGQKVENKYIFFGPKVINQVITMTTLPSDDIVIRFGAK